MSEQSAGILSPEALSACRRLIGVPLRRRQHNSLASRQSIFRWVKASGDRNPLWLDEGYGRRSAVGSIVAPPCWLYSVDDTLIVPKLSGCHAIYGGVDFEFRRWVRLGDELSIQARLLDVREKQGGFCGPMALQMGEAIYTNQSGEVVAKAVSKALRTPRAAAVTAGKYADWQKYRYSRAELDQVEADYDAEEVRGAEPRYWEDVAEGESIRAVVRGPLTSEDMLQFICSTRPALGFKEFHRYRQSHPDAAFLDPKSGIYEAWEASMLSDEVAQMFGFPFAHDSGVDRISWIGSMLTNWMGDHGFLRRLSVDLLLPNVYGDVTWCRGKVVSKTATEPSISSLRAPVEVELWCENERRQITARGKAIVELPSLSTTNG